MTSASLGVALALAGLPLAWVARSLLGAGDSRAYSIGFMLLALLMVLKWRALFSLKLYGTALSTITPLLFLVPVLILTAWDDPLGQPAQFILYSILLFLACQTVEVSRLSSLPYALLGTATTVSVITLTMYAFILSNSPSDIADSGRLTAGDTYNPNFVAFSGGLGIVASMLLGTPSRTHRAFQVVVIGFCLSVCFLAVLLSVTRSVYGGIALCALAALIAQSHRRTKSSNGIHTLRTWLLIFIPILAAVFGVGYFLLGDTLLQYPLITIERTLLGLEGIISGTGGVDVSSDTRFELRQHALERLNIGGHGFDALYVDFPILQAYYDLGVLGGTAFFLIGLVIPSLWVIRTITTARSVHSTVPLAYIYIFFLPNILLHGKPYDFAIWLPVLLAYVGMSRVVGVPKQLGPTVAAYN